MDLFHPKLNCLLLSAVLISGLCEARTISMVTTNWAPYYSEELDEDGVITALVREAYSRVGHKTSIRFIPWKRAMQEGEIGTSDVVMGAYYSEERAKRFIYSHPFYEIKVGLIALKSLGVTHFRSLEDLKPYTIGVSRGWANSEAFDKATFLHKEEATNQILNVRKLFKKRVDMVVMAHGVFNYERNRMRQAIDQKFIFIKPLLGRKPLYLMAGKDLPRSEQFIDDFNRGLGMMIRDGSYEKILQRFGFTEDPGEKAADSPRR
ncbi:substrate-binding periplasmic protein [Dongshaea marina]|uniref:substrate-binding periplasmic protein n=1 Tax=Dongshaea marina TaxID=2047966 RepID=UPI0018FF6EF3|nr:transporter substrate-binding domain-containing protein [Dongshaea marina]